MGSRPAVAAGAGLLPGAGWTARRLLPPAAVGRDPLLGRGRDLAASDARGLPPWARVYAFFRRRREHELISEFHDRLTSPAGGSAGRTNVISVRFPHRVRSSIRHQLLTRVRGYCLAIPGRRDSGTAGRYSTRDNCHRTDVRLADVGEAGGPVTSLCDSRDRGSETPTVRRPRQRHPSHLVGFERLRPDPAVGTRRVRRAFGCGRRLDAGAVYPLRTPSPISAVVRLAKPELRETAGGPELSVGSSKWGTAAPIASIAARSHGADVSLLVVLLLRHSIASATSLNSTRCSPALRSRTALTSAGVTRKNSLRLLTRLTRRDANS